MQRVSPPAMIKVKKGQRPESVKHAMLIMMKWCRITTIHLIDANVQADGVNKLAAVLGQCASLAHLDLRGNGIGAEGAGRLAAVLGQCASLAHLDLVFQMSDDEIAYRESAAVMLHDAFPIAVPGFEVSPEIHWRLPLTLLQELVRETLQALARDLRVAHRNGGQFQVPG